MSLRSRRAALVLALIFFGCVRSLQAHGTSASVSHISVQKDSVVLEIGFNLADAIAHFHLDADRDQRVSTQELASAALRLTAFVNENVNIRWDGKRIELSNPQARITRLASGEEILFLTYSEGLPLLPQQISIRCEVGLFETLGQNHTHLIKITAAGKVQQGALSLAHPSEIFPISSPQPLRSQLREFLIMGIKHIFLGYDHILFLLAVIVVGGSLGQLIKVVTAFTGAHSLTLILAALQIVNLPSRLIECSIALSIAYVAFENLVIRSAAHRWVLTFIFGLVHGFGFANVLREMGLPGRGLIASLLSFNVGVEVGQLAIVLLLLPITLWINRQTYRKGIVNALSMVVAAFGIGWFIERAFGLSFMPF